MYVSDYPQFAWELRYGMFGTDRAFKQWGVNWTFVPQAFIFALGAFGYLAAAYVGYILWPPNGVDILVIGLTRTGLLLIYTLLTILVCLACYSYYVVKVELI